MPESPRVLTRGAHRVTMADVDAARIIYFASPMRWQEQLFSGWLHERGHSLSRQFADGIGSPVVSASVNYHQPVSLDDQLDLVLTVEDVGQRSFTLRMDAYRTPHTQVAVQIHTRHVYVAFPATDGGPLQPRPLPDWFRRLLTDIPTPDPVRHNEGITA